jgi:hypothetical protein
MRPPARSDVAVFLAWVLYGAAGALAVAGALTIGPVAAVVVIGALYPLLVWSRGRPGVWTGVVSGAGLLALYVAHVGGLLPWLFWVVGVAGVVSGVVLFSALRRRAGRAAARAEHDHPSPV